MLQRSDHLYLFAGIDPAPSEGHRSDDGAITSLAAWPKNPAEPTNIPDDWWRAPVHGRRVRKKRRGQLTGLSAREWSGIIHHEHQNFGYARICMDPNGGGTFVKRELASHRAPFGGAEMNVTPIVTPDDPAATVAHIILSMFKRGDPYIEALWPELAGDDLLNDAAYSHVKTAFENGNYIFPKPLHEWSREELDAMPEARRWAHMAVTKILPDQLCKIIVAMREDGTYATTKRGAHQFAAVGKKDFASSFIYADVAFLTWLAQADESWFQEQNSKTTGSFKVF